MCFLQPVIKTIFICTDLGDQYHSALLQLGNLLLLCKAVTTSTITTEVGGLILSNSMSGIPPPTRTPHEPPSADP